MEITLGIKVAGNKSSIWTFQTGDNLSNNNHSAIMPLLIRKMEWNEEMKRPS